MADIVTTRIFQDGEKNITAAKLNDIVASSTIQPAFVSSKPSTSTIATTDNLLVLQTAGTYAKAPFQTVIDSVSAGINSDTEIWKVRLRSFNAIGNPTFEVDQVNAGNAINPSGNARALDRWTARKTASAIGIKTQQGGSAPILLPGMNSAISSRILRITLTAQQTSLAAGDGAQLYQQIEGSQLRELISDVTSLQILVRCTSAFKFGITLQDSASAYSLTKLATIPTPNVWTLLQFPNIPVWTPSGTFPLTAGSVGYQLWICLATGTTNTSPANDTWQTGQYWGAVGQDNFGALPVNSIFDVAFIQHEPGSVCSTPMDCPFSTNYHECLRYYCKSYEYSTAPGTIQTGQRQQGVMASATTSVTLQSSWPRPTAKIPTVTIYDDATGAINSVHNSDASTSVGVSSTVAGSRQLSQLVLASSQAAGNRITFHYTADTGW